MATNAELLNECGTKLSAMDALLARATERMAYKNYIEAKKAIAAAHSLLGDAGLALAKVADAVLRPEAPPVVVPPVPPPIVVPPPVVVPPTVPPVEPPVDARLQYDEPTEIAMGEIAWGQSLRDYPAQMRKVNVLKFVAQKSGVVSLGVAEFGSPPTTYQCSLSVLPGDLTNKRQGNQPDVAMAVSAGEVYYFNFRAWSSDIGRTATFEVQSIVVEGSWSP